MSIRVQEACMSTNSSPPPHMAHESSIQIRLRARQQGISSNIGKEIAQTCHSSKLTQVVIRGHPGLEHTLPSISLNINSNTITEFEPRVVFGKNTVLIPPGPHPWRVTHLNIETTTTLEEMRELEFP